MKKMTLVLTFLACLCVFNSCSRGYGCPYSSTELKPLNTVEQKGENAYALIDHVQSTTCDELELTE